MDQRDLVIRAKGGDHDAFTSLVAVSIARLDAAARLILRDGELARDAVQDTLVRAWRDLPGLREPDRFDAWLHRLTVNASLDLARRRQRRSIEVQLTPLAVPSIADATADLAERQQLDEALGRLEPVWRAIVVMHYYLGMPLPDIAVTLHIPLGTAKSRLHRALREMRTSLVEPDAERSEPVRGGQLA